MIVTPDGHALGRKIDRFDPRDHAFLPKLVSPTAYPKTVDPRADFPLPIKDQGQEGACTGFGTTRAWRRHLQKAGLPDFDASEQFTYRGGRSIEHTLSQDSGCQIRDVVKAASKIGFAPESMLPYSDRGWKKKPGAAVYAEALKHRLSKYQRVDNTSWDAVRAAVATNGNIIIGIWVYASFESDKVAQSGVVPMPAGGEASLGGHCMDGDGYEAGTDGDWLIVANSWDDTWGDRGYCYLPRSYVTDPKLTSDCWTIAA